MENKQQEKVIEFLAMEIAQLKIDYAILRAEHLQVLEELQSTQKE